MACQEAKKERYTWIACGNGSREGMANAARAAGGIKHLQKEVVSKAQELWNQLDFSSLIPEL